MIRVSDVNLTLFFTGGMSLRHWDQTGLLSREIEFYLKLADHLKSINFITYGGNSDKDYVFPRKNINVFPAEWNSNYLLNLLNVFTRAPSVLKESHIFKTNQILGGHIPVFFKSVFKKKLIARCGYLYGRFQELNGYESGKIEKAKSYEKKVFKRSDVCIVATERDKRWVIQNYGIEDEKIRIIPNFVNVGLFSKKENSDFPKYDLIYVGRSGPQKNLFSLLKALCILKTRNQPIRLLMVGGCSKDEKLKVFVKSERLEVAFIENVSNQDLPGFMCKARSLILPSFFEGNPKVLIEGMSCSLPCIGTDVEGNRDIIRHQETGYLCGVTPEEIANGIEEVLKDTALQKRLGENARKYVVENYSIDEVLKKEINLIQEALAGG